MTSKVDTSEAETMLSDQLNDESVLSDQLNSDYLMDKTSSIYKSICHKCPLDKRLRKRDQRRLIVVSVICVLFMVAEIIGGVISNSLAIASDAAHLLTDFGAFMVSLAALWISSKPQSRQMSFGFHRAEVLGALISVLSIWLITGVLVYMAVQRLLNPDYELNAFVMICVSVGGILANIIMGIILVFYKGGKSPESNNSEDTLNIRSATVHVVGDLLQSVAVFIASLIVYFYPHMKIIDPICTFIFSVIVIITTFYIMKDIFCVLMEGFPKNMNFVDVRNVLYSIPGVIKVHNMRMWSLTMDKIAFSAHIVVRKGEKHSDILKSATRIIYSNLDIYEVTIQIEESGDPVDTCSVCI